MQYYRVKPEYANNWRYTWNSHHQGIRNSVLIANELYTPGEFRRIANCPAWFEPVTIPKSRIYWMFGARFESKMEV